MCFYQNIYKHKLFILFLLLYCCGCSNTDYHQHENIKNIKSIKNFIANSCPISEVIDINQNIILATLYYKDNYLTLSEKDKVVLQQVINTFNICHKKIMVIGYASNKEAYNNPKKAANISYHRAKNVYDYLKKDIPSKYIFFAFLSNFKNKYIENNKTATLGNQRVEIIMLGSGITSLNLLNK